MFSALARRHKSFQLRSFSSNKSLQLRSFSSNKNFTLGHERENYFIKGFTAEQTKERLELLKEIYSPLDKLDKGKNEWKILLESGTVWENYFQPFKWREEDYAFQAEQNHFLSEITKLSKFARFSSLDFLRRMNVSFSQQSCHIEGNSLGLAESREIYNALTGYANNLDEMVEDPNKIPSPQLLRLDNSREVIEIRNHLLATHHLIYGMSNRDLDLHDVKKIHRILLKDTPIENVESSDGTLHRAGEFRTCEMGSGGYHLTVYPYGPEVPALMKRYEHFYSDCNKNTDFHPLILASRILTSFFHIHPFIDGNGRLGRSIMAHYLIRNGYPPIVFQEISRSDYINSIYLFTAMEKTASFYSMVLENVYSTLMNNQKVIE